MNEQKKAQTLKEVEAEVLAEGREWTRQRLQQRWQHKPRRRGRFFPLQERQQRPLTLHTVVEK